MASSQGGSLKGTGSATIATCAGGGAAIDSRDQIGCPDYGQTEIERAQMQLCDAKYINDLTPRPLVQMAVIWSLYPAVTSSSSNWPRIRIAVYTVQA